MKCTYCKKEFIPKDNTLSHIKRNPPKYCSHKCHGMDYRGRKFKIEHKQKLREAKLKNPTRYWLGKKRPNLHSKKTRKEMSERRKNRPSDVLGKHWKLSEETKRKMSLARQGNKSSNWKGGISKIHKRIRAGLNFRLWREEVFKRDNYTCQKCKKRGNYLHPHHIENFAIKTKKRFLLGNGITLCKSCHNLFHKIWGHKNNNKKQITRFITN